MLDRGISTNFFTHRVSLQSGHPNFEEIFCLTQNGGHFEFFAKIARHKNAYISKTMLDRAISTKCLTHRVSLQSGHPNFQNILVSPKMAAILNFQIFRKNCKNAYISKTVLDRADYADFGCHNSIRLKAEHILFGTLCFTAKTLSFFLQAIL